MMMNNKYTPTQLSLLVILRILIGWHFLYEGIAKLFNPNWTSQSYLLDSQWFFAPIFHWIASHSTAIHLADFLNTWGLILIGLGLILGFLTRTATIAGVVLLSLYYISHPPLVGITYATPSEGSYLIVNKILIELAALLVLMAFPTGNMIGIDRMLPICRKKQQTTSSEDNHANNN